MKEMMDAYVKELAEELNRLDGDAFEKAIHILLDVYARDGQVFIAGNGGSAATANHFVCDFGKNAVQEESGVSAFSRYATMLRKLRRLATTLPLKRSSVFSWAI